MDCLIHFAQFHVNFRIPEIESLAKLRNINVKYFLDDYIPSVAMYDLWEEATTYEEMFDKIKRKPERYAPYMQTSFKFVVDSYGLSVPLEYQVSTIESFSFLGFEGKIDLKHPEVTFVIVEDYGENSQAKAVLGKPNRIYFGVLLSKGHRQAVDRYNLKKRKYLGTTSMDAELSLVMANQALAAPGKLMYDPFVGTGSFLVASAHFGATTVGSDIDGRQIRGKDKHSIRSNIEQYGIGANVLDCLVFDVKHNPWRENIEWFDAIITDPPYGVRAGAKTIAPDVNYDNSDAVASYENQRHSYGRYPQTVPYELDQIMVDLVEFSARYLKVGGRLVYWLPTVTDEYHDSDLPTHPCLKLISNSEQNFGSWSRRLITLEKTQTYQSDGTVKASSTYQLGRKLEKSAKISGRDVNDSSNAPAHKFFREKYFSPKTKE
ncbi:S-adenosyl-L-methionine-dependent methyltransferase [Paraphysoderma sedebokerense]|nr:S-adenosyl-L-methionine-dependent methyltransferase [Paraphysoderma sedebokerense]